MSCRWFGGKAKMIREIKIVDHIPIVEDSNVSYLLFLEVRYTEGTQDLYLLPVSFALTKKAEEPLEELVVEGLRVRLDYEWLTIKSKLIMEESPQSIIARLHARRRTREFFMMEPMIASFVKPFSPSSLEERRMRGRRGEMIGLSGKDVSEVTRRERDSVEFPDAQGRADQYIDPLRRQILLQALSESERGDQSRSGDHPIPDRKGRLSNISLLLPEDSNTNGRAQTPITVGLLQGFDPQSGGCLDLYPGCDSKIFRKGLIRGQGDSRSTQKHLRFSFRCRPGSRIHLQLQEWIEGHYLEMTALLGKRTGEMHLALSSRPEEPDFAPEPFSMLYQRSVFQSMRALLRRVLQTLKNSIRNAAQIDSGRGAFDPPV